MSDLLKGYYKPDFLNLEGDALISDDGYYIPPDDSVDNNVTIPGDTTTTEYCPKGENTPCDSILVLDPACPDNIYSANGEPYHNAGEALAASAIISGLGSAISGAGQIVGSIFGFKQAKIDAETAKTQAEYELALQQQKRKTALNLMIGGVAFIAMAVGVYATVRYLKRK